ncbi:Calcium uptake protein 1, mitochondrial, partial [Cichlidogyrus casuarinus]
TDKLTIDISKDSVFYALGDKALISFSDFVFLLTVLCTPPRQFEIAFRMFDLNGDGQLDAEEFEVVRSVVMDTTAMGKRHRDHSTTGSTLKPVSSNSALTHFFFGPRGDKKLTIEKFLNFQTQLEVEIMRLEYDRLEKRPDNSNITEVAFAKSLVIYAGFQENKRRKMLKRIKTYYDEDGEGEGQGISFKEFVDFNKFLKCIADVDTALTFYHMAGASIDPTTLAHVAHAVANVELQPHLIEVVFRLFDENDDGHLSNREFVSVMKNRLLRGLDKPMDTGFIRFLSALTTCSIEQTKLLLPKQH